MDERLKKLIEEAVANADPELVEKFGNPLDENDPRMWSPTERIEKGISLEDQVRYLALDVEAHSLALTDALKRNIEFNVQLDRLQRWAAEQMATQFMELVKTDPEAAANQLAKYLGETGMDSVMPKPSYGPLEDSPDAAIRYAGSAEGASPHQMVETPNGLIDIKDIPGYVDDPKWRPSPDWVDANCMCPTHVRAREAANRTNPGDDDFPTGLYL